MTEYRMFEWAAKNNVEIIIEMIDGFLFFSFCKDGIYCTFPRFGSQEPFTTAIEVFETALKANK